MRPARVDVVEHFAFGLRRGVGLAGRRGGRSGSGTGIAWLGFRGGVRWARGQANTVFQALDLASNVRGVLVGLATNPRRRPGVCHAPVRDLRCSRSIA